jgi:hypothetical protein
MARRAGAKALAIISAFVLQAKLNTVASMASICRLDVLEFMQYSST